MDKIKKVVTLEDYKKDAMELGIKAFGSKEKAERHINSMLAVPLSSGETLIDRYKSITLRLNSLIRNT